MIIKPIVPVAWLPESNKFLLWEYGPEQICLLQAAPWEPLPFKGAFEKPPLLEGCLLSVYFIHRNPTGSLRIRLDYPFTLKDEQKMHDWASSEGFTPRAQYFLAQCTELKGVALLPLILPLKLATARGELTYLQPTSLTVRR